LQRPVTPRRTFVFERRVARLLWELGREMVQQVFQQWEPVEPELLPLRLRLGQDEYRRNRRTRCSLPTLFGTIALSRWLYQPLTPGTPSVFPLEIALGVIGGRATPALGDVVGRLAAELTQSQTRGVLAERHGVCWSVGTLRKVTAALAQGLAPLRHETQLAQVLRWLDQAAKSQGKHAVTLVVGRDGVMLPMRPFWEEAAVATLSVVNRAGQRLGTVYLGQLPEANQPTLTRDLTRLILDVLAAWTGATPRLHYVTDAGHHPQDYFRRVLRSLRHPRTGAKLPWTWCVDFYHAAERITTLAEALFGPGREACTWAAKMRRVLKEKTHGVTRVLQSAQALRRSRGLHHGAKPFRAALDYLRKYRSHLDYARYQRRGLAIGSGVTEAACKTIVGYRFKQSGLRWTRDHGQHILDLRLLLKSGVWSEADQHHLTRFPPCQPTTCRPLTTKATTFPLIFSLLA
jgi:hypothetical protein